ncbi:hypothetical protein BX666DRAFT_1975256 [Dichotomocladium elegans]|nr:hypothetical protein BX666DRAFT_1975256 [Dichotomocladium elegans]
MTADIEQYDMQNLDALPADKLAVFIMATYGEGEPTDNAAEFWEQITDESPEFSQTSSDMPLKNLRYIIFGLGNKTYEHYNAVGRILDQRLSDLGATRVGERGEGDDDGSLEEDFLAWQEEMWPKFCEALGVDENMSPSGPRVPAFKVTPQPDYETDKVYHGELVEWSQKSMQHGAKNPYAAPVTSRDLFTDTDRHCLHLEIDISGARGLSYQTGDHIAIWPTNNEVEVFRLASILGLAEKLDDIISVEAVDTAAVKKHPFPSPTTYRAIFRHYLDICAPVSRQTLMSLIEFAPSPTSEAALRRLATDKDAYRIEVSEAVRNLGEVLELCQDDEGTTIEGFFSSVPFDLIVESLSRLQPRYYSISSSSRTHPTSVSVTAVTLAYQPTPHRTVYGVNTNYLWRLHLAKHELDQSLVIVDKGPDYDLAGPRNMFAQTKIPVHIRHSQFKLSRNASLPVIMVGPGTGVAPFRGFVHERAQLKREGKEVGPTLLFFGCRHPKQDFLYKDEWPELFETLGAPSRIITAFSRETARKVYVQHRLAEVGEEIWGLMEKHATIYVCGDAKNMARDVQQTFIGFAIKYGNKSEQEAQEYIKRLRSTGRYQEDVWS